MVKHAVSSPRPIAIPYISQNIQFSDSSQTEEAVEDSDTMTDMDVMDEMDSPPVLLSQFCTQQCSSCYLVSSRMLLQFAIWGVLGGLQRILALQGQKWSHTCCTIANTPPGHPVGIYESPSRPPYNHGWCLQFHLEKKN